MFEHIRMEIYGRIFTASQYLRQVLEKMESNLQKTGKGLIFVQLYAIWEYTLTESFVAAMRSISQHSIPAIEIRPEILSIAYDSDWDSLRDTSKKRSWVKRINLMLNSRSDSPVILSDSIFPFDNSHFRISQVETLWKLLGITVATTSNPVHIGRIDEIVNHRNAIAHGRETAETIGRRFTKNELEERVKDIQDICLYVLDCIEEHVSEPSNCQMN